MAGRDNVLFHASVASGTAAGTAVPLSLLYGIENVRQGYGAARLKNIRAIYIGGYSANATTGIPIEVKNSNWIDSAGLTAIKVQNDVALARNSLSFMRGRDKALEPNTAWTITATIPVNTTAAGDIYVLLEIDYAGVDGKNAENLAGSPVMKKCTSGTITGSANTYLNLGTFDNLLQGTEYVISEASLGATGGVNETHAYFVIVEGFSNQRGLTRIFPVRNYGVAEQIEGSVVLTKQTYNLGLISSASPSSAVFNVFLEMVASKN